jgi:predicted amidophosphoribosyltransferase
MLSLAERQENVRGAFRINRTQSLTGRHVLIVDDVLTTGSTADELAKQVRRAKPADISVVAIARATGT